MERRYQTIVNGVAQYIFHYMMIYFISYGNYNMIMITYNKVKVVIINDIYNVAYCLKLC